MNNELYHWKYIKREKVGDKWKYYYDTGSLKKDAKKFVGNDSKEKMMEAKAKLDAATAKRNAMIRRETKAYGESNIGENVRNRTVQYTYQKDSESKRDQYNKQIAKDMLNPFNITPSGIAKQIENNTKAVEYNHKAEKAKLSAEGYQRRIDKDVEKLSPYRENSDIANRELIKAAKEYAKAQEEYFNSAAGKIDKASQSIAKARDYVYELFDESPVTKAKRAANRKQRKIRR